MKLSDWSEWPDPEFVGMILFVIATLIVLISLVLGATIVAEALAGH